MNTPSYNLTIWHETRGRVTRTVTDRTDLRAAILLARKAGRQFVVEVVS